MKKLGVFTGIALLMGGTVVAAYGGGATADQEGKRLYTDKCQMCHGIHGNGDGPAAAAFSPGPADFADPAFWKKFDDKTIANVIEHGRGQMPAFELKPDEVRAIVNYISQNFKPQK